MNPAPLKITIAAAGKNGYPAGMTYYHDIFARRCWIFDLDGTLTVPVHDFAAIRAELGMTDTDPDILGFLASLPAAEAAARHARLMEIEYELSARTAVAPGAFRLLEALLRRGSNVGILTRNTREIALHTLGQIGLGKYFDREVVLGRDEAEPKPHPEGVEKLLDVWGRAAGDAVMVGDYLFDLQVGRAAGTATIHVDRDGVFPWPELADLTVVELGELAEGVVAAGSDGVP